MLLLGALLGAMGAMGATGAMGAMGAQVMRANDTELLAWQALQAHASLPALHEALTRAVRKGVVVKAVPGIFAQQQGTQPPDGEYQLDDFGALVPWNDVLHQLDADPLLRLLVMVRHGQAWENLNPTPNSNCEFELDGHVVQNFDSPLTPEGGRQAMALNGQLLAPAGNSSARTRFQAMGLARPSATFVVSPLSRALQTAQRAFHMLPLASGAFVADELVRANIGRDVCNFRHSVQSATSAAPLPFPWQTGCQLPAESLLDIYSESAVPFAFPIRPAGVEGFGLLSDSDQLWRADVTDDEVLTTRALAFLAQLRALTAPGSVTALVTHGEMVSAIYEAAGEAPYGPKNTEVVPLLVRFAE